LLLDFSFSGISLFYLQFLENFSGLPEVLLKMPYFFRKSLVKALKRFLYNLFMRIVFTFHVKQQIRIRNILEDEVISAITYPHRTVKRNGKYRFISKLLRGTIEVVCDKTERHIKVITAYWR